MTHPEKKTHDQIANEICEAGVLNKRATSALIKSALDTLEVELKSKIAEQEALLAMMDVTGTDMAKKLVEQAAEIAAGQKLRNEIAQSHGRLEKKVQELTEETKFLENAVDVAIADAKYFEASLSLVVSALKKIQDKDNLIGAALGDEQAIYEYQAIASEALQTQSIQKQAKRLEAMEKIRPILKNAWNHAATITQSAVPIEAKVALAFELKDFINDALKSFESL